ncbi:MAG: sensor histidine kinase, partial [Fimbriimonadaceae bacterium]|nr:sensor histidine kinase [Fimbriimonadaceae bacterium]
HEFDDEEITALEALAKQAALSIDNAKLNVRSTLMQEMHHRVKNNLQQVASLLRIQIRQSELEETKQALSDSLARMLAIASVHELLSREDLDHVGLKELADTLAHHVQQSVLSPEMNIRFFVRGDNVYLNTAQATQVALIMNELIGNAVEHGFAGSREGEIHVSIEEKNGEIGLWVSNNGVPLPEEFDCTQGHLGLKIIDSLTKSLGGSFTMENRLGWTVSEVRFSRAGAE